MFQLPQQEKQFLYTTNYCKDEESLCKMEIKYLFNKVIDKKYFFTDMYVNPSRSPFIKKCLSIDYTCQTLKQIIDKIVADNLLADRYKVVYLSIDDNVGFHERRKIECEVGLSILGEAELDDPDIIFGITEVDGKWVFGKCESSDCKWLAHNIKPFSYSNALKVNVSRAIVNIAVGNNLQCTVVDPCCGIGTVLIEAISMGINIKGYEINGFIGRNARKNLKHFGYENVITICDMNDIKEKFDIAIVDLPYGIFTSITPEQQLAIMCSTRRIANSMVIVTFEHMETQIISAGFNIQDECTVAKGKFIRYIYICN